MSGRRPLILRNRRFGLLWVGQVMSQAGTRVYQIATLWWLLTQNSLGKLGGSGAAMGIFMVLSAIPAIIFLKKIGVLIDKRPSKHILVTADVLAAVTTLILVLCLHFHVFIMPMVYITGFLLAFFQAFIDPTLNKAIPELTEKEDTEAGVAFVASTQSLANFGGAVAGAVLIAKFGMEGAVAMNCLSFVISASANLGIKFQKRTPEANATEASTMEAEPGKAVDIFAGLPLLKSVLIGFGCLNFFSTPLFIVMPAYTKMVFHLGPQWLATFESCLWLGLIAGTFSPPLIRFEKNILKIGGLLLFVCGLCIAIPGLIVNMKLYAFMLFMAGWSVGLNNVKFMTLFQEIVPDGLKGRFFAVLSALVSFTFPVAYLVFGLMIDRVSITLLCLIQGAGVMVLATWFLAKSRKPLSFRPAPGVALLKGIAE